MDSPALSIVTTLYRSGAYILPFYNAAVTAAKTLTEHFEIVLVNDGSPDDSLQQALALHTRDSRVVVVDLARNFGHHPALVTGLSYARGELIFVIDSDMEEDPAWLGLFHKTLNAEAADVVYGVQSTRKGGIFERFSGWIFYKTFNAVSDFHIPANATTARLMRRRYVDAFLQYQEREIFLHGLWPHAGYRQVPQNISKGSKGSTAYSIPRRVALMVNAITSFSNAPLIMIFYTGLFLSLGAVGYIAWLLQRRYFHGIPLTGWSSLIVSIWFLGGLTILFLGVLGIYMAKMFSEIKHRPRTLVRDVYPNANPRSQRRFE